jgi:hypothetical protein
MGMGVGEEDGLAAGVGTALPPLPTIELMRRPLGQGLIRILEAFLIFRTMREFNRSVENFWLEAPAWLGLSNGFVL